MVLPDLNSWVEQGDNLASFIVNAGEVRTFVKTASVAGKGKVVGIVAPAMLPRNDVVEMKGPKRGFTLRQPAVFAATSSALPYQGADGTVH